jgi:hypothetical protein
MSKLKTQVERMADLARDGLQTDGGHHKQWYLEQILEACGQPAPDHDPGVPA